MRYPRQVKPLRQESFPGKMLDLLHIVTWGKQYVIQDQKEYVTRALYIVTSGIEGIQIGQTDRRKLRRFRIAYLCSTGDCNTGGGCSAGTCSTGGLKNRLLWCLTR